MIVPVILSGGSGERLWPLSRSLHPKQFINLVNKDSTIFQDTILRLPNKASNPLIICNEEHRFLAAEQLRQINISPHGIILEPVGKNTAPAIALAALKLINEKIDPILLVLPADHIIKNIDAFHESIEIAQNLAEENKLVTFGIHPDRAETGYGYIETDTIRELQFHNIKSFKEKPNQANADKYFQSGDYLWNSGIFMFKASIYLDELKKFEPLIIDACIKSLKTIENDSDFIRVDNKEFLKCPKKSIDYAVMENTKNALVVKLDANWSDIGSWKSLMQSKDKDENGNVCEGNIFLDDVQNTFTYSTTRLISVSGVSDLIIIDTQDALLVTNAKNSHNIKNVIQKLKSNNRPELDFHRKVYRPWGYYDLIDAGVGFQAKRIVVNPGAKLSLQKHLHRAEHWIVVSGIATITRGNKISTLKTNESTYISKEELHRLENHEKTPLKIIEIQTGSYLDEDDIIRIEDHYKRV